MLSLIRIRTFLQQFSVFSFSSSYKLAAKLTGHLAQITQLAFSDDGEVLATGSSDETVRLWSTGTFKLLHELRDKDSRWGQTCVVKWFRGPPVSRYLFIGTGRGHLVIYKYNHTTARHVVSENLFKTTTVEDLDFCTATRRLVVCDTYGEIRAYHVEATFTMKLLWKYQVPGNYIIRRLVLQSNDVHAYVLHTGQRVVLDSTNGKYRSECSVPTALGGVAISPDNALTLVDNLSKGFDLYISNTLSRKALFFLPGKLNKAKDAAFIESGSAVACPAPYGAIYIYNATESWLSSPKEILRHKNVRVVTGHSYPTRHLIASGSGAGPFDICIWEKKVPQGRSSVIFGGWFSFQGLFNMFVLFTVVSTAGSRWPDTVETVANKISTHLPRFEASPSTVVYFSTVTAAHSTPTVVVHSPLSTASTQTSTTTVMAFQVAELPSAIPSSPIPDGYFDEIEEQWGTSDALDGLD
ncbi:WD40 repeat-like protein [Coprinopsis marcescibilis]|uniref:WD40 repeat-like protein n=1 Tax=Coprinopsis marcescibilis TaxID=230819 RepID=A0A5C3KB92_COPMA|nr:WD40 repeat-like protein [Coprinopsis marcescibilis]